LPFGFSFSLTRRYPRSLHICSFSLFAMVQLMVPLDRRSPLLRESRSLKEIFLYVSVGASFSPPGRYFWDRALFEVSVPSRELWLSDFFFFCLSFFFLSPRHSTQKWRGGRIRLFISFLISFPPSVFEMVSRPDYSFPPVFVFFSCSLSMKKTVCPRIMADSLGCNFRFSETSDSFFLVLPGIPLTWPSFSEFFPPSNLVPLISISDVLVCTYGAIGNEIGGPAHARRIPHFFPLSNSDQEMLPSPTFAPRWCCRGPPSQPVASVQHSLRVALF